MKARDIIQTALNELGMKQESLAEKLGISPQNFSKKLVYDTIRAKEFFEAIDALGLEVTIRHKSGRDVKAFRSGVLPQVSMVVNHVRYDTFKADALCHMEPMNGWIAELYRDYRGQHFLAVCSDWTSAKPAVIPCEESDAKRFYEMYRDVEDDPPDEAFEEMVDG